MAEHWHEGRELAQDGKDLCLKNSTFTGKNVIEKGTHVTHTRTHKHEHIHMNTYTLTHAHTPSRTSFSLTRTHKAHTPNTELLKAF